MQKRSELYEFREVGTGCAMDSGKQSLPAAGRREPTEGSSRK